MKMKSVFFTLSLMFFVVKSQAGNIEIAQWIPWTSVTQEAKTWPLNFQTQAQNFTLQWQEWKPQALQTEFAVNGQLAELSITKAGIQATARGMSAVVKVGAITLDQTVMKEIGGNQIQVHIKASCQPFEIRVPAFDISMKAPFTWSGSNWYPTLTGLGLGIREGWSVSTLTCEGPLGVEDRVTTIIQDSLRNSDALASLLQNYLAPELQRRWQIAWNQITSERYQNLHITGWNEPMENGFFLRGEISIGNGDWRVPLPSQLSVLGNVQTPQLVLANEGFAALAKENLGQFSIQKYNLQQVDAFAKLMRSRFLQLFAWSDLLHFGRSTPFWLSTLPNPKIDLRSLGGGKWQVQMQSLGVIEVERKGKLRNYINWGVGLAATATTEVKDSQLLLQTSPPKSNLNWSFDPQYAADFKPNGISAKVLQQAAESLFTAQSTSVQLPSLQIGDHLWKLNGWVENNGLIWMEWK